jgi:hypothetical protein
MSQRKINAAQESKAFIEQEIAEEAEPSSNSVTSVTSCSKLIGFLVDG